MTIENLIFAVQTCNNGLLEFNNGIAVRAFLYEQKWYPLRATVNCARAHGEEDEVTTDRALVELAYLLPYIKVEDQEFNNNFPVEINDERRFQEINDLSDLILKLTI